MSAVSRIPAVSMNRNSTPPITQVSSTVSRVVPGTSETMARSSCSSAFSNVLFPLFGAPTMATGTPLRIAFPTRNESARAVQREIASSSSAASLSRSANSTSSSLKSSSSSISDVSSSSSARIFPSSSEYPPRSWFIATRCCTSEPDAITSATASACARSIFPFTNALRVNSPASARRHPASVSSSSMRPTMYADAWQHSSAESSPVYECGAR